MAIFDESKVINALHTDKAEIGKKYWFSDNLINIKQYVEQNISDCHCGELIGINDSVSDFNFICKGAHSSPSSWALLYPYEEPPKKLMTNRQLMEWLAKGNGIWKFDKCSATDMTIACNECYLNEEVEDKVIRSWDSEEWIEPTYKRYLMDCKGVTQDEIDDVAWRDGC